MKKVIIKGARGKRLKKGEVADFWYKVDRTALTKENLINTLIQAKEQEAMYFVIQVKNNSCDDVETIINNTSCIDYKIDYYKNTYDDDLFLKANKDIRIVNFTFAFKWAEIRCELL